MCQRSNACNYQARPAERPALGIGIGIGSSSWPACAPCNDSTRCRQIPRKGMQVAAPLLAIPCPALVLQFGAGATQCWARGLHEQHASTKQACNNLHTCTMVMAPIQPSPMLPGRQAGRSAASLTGQPAMSCPHNCCRRNAINTRFKRPPARPCTCMQAHGRAASINWLQRVQQQQRGMYIYRTTYIPKDITQTSLKSSQSAACVAWRRARTRCTTQVRPVSEYLYNTAAHCKKARQPRKKFDPNVPSMYCSSGACTAARRRRPNCPNGPK